MDDIDALLTDFYAKYAGEELTDDKRSAIKQRYGQDYDVLLKDLYRKYADEDLQDDKLGTILDTYGIKGAVDQEPAEQPTEELSGWDKGIELAKNMVKLKGLQAWDVAKHLAAGGVEVAAGVAGLENFRQKIILTGALEATKMLGGDYEKEALRIEQMMEGMTPEQREEYVNSFDPFSMGSASAYLQNKMTNIGDEIRETTRQYETNIVDDIAAGNIDQAAAQVANGIAGSAPSLILAAFPGGAAILGASAGAQKLEELEREGEKLNKNSVANAVANGTAEWAFEQITYGLFKPARQILRGNKEAAEEFSKSFTKNVFSNFAQEGGSEAATTIAQQLSDDLFNDRELAAKNFWKNTADSFLIGGLMGGGISLTTLGASRVMDQKTKDQVRDNQQKSQQISRELENEELPPDLRRQMQAIQQEIDQETNDLVESEFEYFKSLPREEREAFGELEKQLDEKKAEYDSIKNSDIDPDLKQEMLARTEAEAKALYDQKTELREKPEQNENQEEALPDQDQQEQQEPESIQEPEEVEQAEPEPEIEDYTPEQKQRLKPELKMTFAPPTELRKAKNVEAAAQESTEIRDQYKEIRQLMDCLWK